MPKPKLLKAANEGNLCQVIREIDQLAMKRQPPTSFNWRVPVLIFASIALVAAILYLFWWKERKVVTFKETPAGVAISKDQTKPSVV